MIRTIIQIEGTGKGIRVIVTLRDRGSRVARTHQEGVLQKDVERVVRGLVVSANELLAGA